MRPQNPTVSVVMPVRDGAAFLSEALDSVRAQTFEDLELIVVDDGSTDRTPEILAEFAREDKRIRVVRQLGTGVTQALNRACRDARGQYLARLDADDVALPNRLELQVAFLESHPDVAVVGGAGIFIGDDGVEFGTTAYPSDVAEVAALLDSGRCPVMHSAVTMRAGAFRAASGYRPVMEVAQDYDLWLRITSYGRITNLPNPVVRYRIHASQASTRDFTKTATATSAALAAAHARANGEPDPLDSVRSLDSAVLERLGVRPEDVAAHEVNYALWVARTLARGGHHKEAAPLWSLCAARAGATADPRVTRAAVLRARADALGWRQQRLRSVGLRILAAAFDPRDVGIPLRRVATRATQSRGD